jgi:hypothetical protein
MVRFTETILASGGLPEKQRPAGSATRRPGTWAGDVLDQLTSVLRGRGDEAARLLGIPYAEVVVRFFCPAVISDKRQFPMPDHKPAILLGYNYVRLIMSTRILSVTLQII